MVIIALEGSMAVLIDGDGDSISGDDLPEQPEVSFGSFKEKEARGEDDSRCIIHSDH